MSGLVLGISALYHDSAACLVRGGEIVAAAQEERFSRRKHDARLPVQAIAACLAQAAVAPAALEAVGFYEKPLLRFDRLVSTYLSIAPRGLRSFLRAMPPWLGRKLWIEDELRAALPGYQGPIFYDEHHHAHAASAFFPSPFDEAAILTLDGVGEWTTTSIGLGRGRSVDLCEEVHFPHSLGLLYSAFTQHCGFRVNSGEYKLMGLAPYGEPRFAEKIRRHLLDLGADGSFALDTRCFDFLGGLRMTNGRFAALFEGPARAPEAPLGQREMDLAASIQLVLEEAVLALARRARERTGQKRLCLAGGVALNCVANGRLVREGVFEQVFVQPAAGDAGGALGVALAVAHEVLGAPRPRGSAPEALAGMRLGPGWEDEAIFGWLEEERIPHERLGQDELPSRVAELLADELVVGWFQGRMEFGPRALGSRSILGDPRSPRMQSTLNRKIKFRESFRPFAPAVLAEAAASWFDLPPGLRSPHMMLVAPVHPSRRLPVARNGVYGLDRLRVVRSQIPAVTHVDDSARVQTVGEEAEPRFRALLAAFFARTGCPVVINTSMNVRGEPIVCAPAEAVRCFSRTAMDALVLGRALLRKRSGPQAVAAGAAPRIPEGLALD